MPIAPSPLPLHLTARAFTVHRALSDGVTAGRLRRSDLDGRLWGVRVPVDPDLPMRCLAALAFLPPGSAVSHWTALRLAGVALPVGVDGDTRIHVRVPPGSGRARRRGVVVHHTSRPVAVHPVRGVPTVGRLRAWTDCAAHLPVDELVVLGDGLLRRKTPLHRLDDLADTVAALPAGGRGVARLRAAAPLLAAGTDSPMETRTRLVLVHAGLPVPLVNQPVVDELGDFLAMPDLLYVAARTVIEYDGDIHRTDRATWQRDIDRRNRLQAAGWLTITATADLVLRRPEALVHAVRRALADRSP